MIKTILSLKPTVGTFIPNRTQSRELNLPYQWSTNDLRHRVAQMVLVENKPSWLSAHRYLHVCYHSASLQIAT